MKKVYSTTIITELGEIIIASTDKGLCKIGLTDESREVVNQWLLKHFDEIEENYEKNKTVVEQLLDYFEGKSKSFTLELDLIGTPFQKRVWNVLKAIPYGEVCSYKELATKVGSPKGFRAVGMANNKNPIPIVIPCHRVIGHNGDLVGFAGGLEMKKRMLEFEGLTIHKGKVVTK